MTWVTHQWSGRNKLQAAWVLQGLVCQIHQQVPFHFLFLLHSFQNNFLQSAHPWNPDIHNRMRGIILVTWGTVENDQEGVVDFSHKWPWHTQYTILIVRCWNTHGLTFLGYIGDLDSFGKFFILWKLCLLLLLFLSFVPPGSQSLPCKSPLPLTLVGKTETQGKSKEIPKTCRMVLAEEVNSLGFQILFLLFSEAKQ